MSPDEQQVALYLGDRRLTANSFSKRELREGKTPDFRVSVDGVFAFFCEVKSIEADGWLERQLAQVPAGAIAGGARNDPIFYRLTNDIHEGVKQFDAVNPRVLHPNVLAFVNHDRDCGFLDLVGAVTGNFVADHGNHPVYRQFLEGRIKQEKHRIHLYVWLDDFKPERLWFNYGYAVHQAHLCACFVVDPHAIKQFPA
jgi:hypothetical protein